MTTILKAPLSENMISKTILLVYLRLHYRGKYQPLRLPSYSTHDLLFFLFDFPFENLQTRTNNYIDFKASAIRLINYGSPLVKNELEVFTQRSNNRKTNFTSSIERNVYLSQKNCNLKQIDPNTLITFFPTSQLSQVAFEEIAIQSNINIISLLLIDFRL